MDILKPEFLHVIAIIGTISLIMYFISIYNALMSLKNQVFQDLSNIEVVLKQRNSELIKLIDACKENMVYEKSTLENITKIREQMHQATETHDISDFNNLENSLRSNLSTLFVRAEQYPDLKANNSFLELQHRISDLENIISDRRELYNAQVTINNTRIDQFPAIIITRIFGFKSFELLHFAAEEIKDLDVQDMFKKE